MKDSCRKIAACVLAVVAYGSVCAADKVLTIGEGEEATSHASLSNAVASVTADGTVIRLHTDISTENYVLMTGQSDHRCILDLNGHSVSIKAMIVDCDLTVRNGSVTVGSWVNGGSIMGKKDRVLTLSNLTVKSREGEESDEGPFYLFHGTLAIEDGCRIPENAVNVEGLKIEWTKAAQIGDVFYSSLSNAVAAAKDGETVTVLSSVEESVTVTNAISLVAAENVSLKGVDLTLTEMAKLTLTEPTDLKKPLSAGAPQKILDYTRTVSGTTTNITYTANGHPILRRVDDSTKPATTNYYASLMSALEGVTADNQRIELLANVTNTSAHLTTGTNTHSVVLDLGGHTANLATLAIGCDLVVSNGTVKADTTAMGGASGLLMPSSGTTITLGKGLTYDGGTEPLQLAPAGSTIKLDGARSVPTTASTNSNATIEGTWANGVSVTIPGRAGLGKPAVTYTDSTTGQETTATVTNAGDVVPTDTKDGIDDYTVSVPENVTLSISWPNAETDRILLPSASGAGSTVVTSNDGKVSSVTVLVAKDPVMVDLGTLPLAVKPATLVGFAATEDAKNQFEILDVPMAGGPLGSSSAGTSTKKYYYRTATTLNGLTTAGLTELTERPDASKLLYTVERDPSETQRFYQVFAE